MACRGCANRTRRLLTWLGLARHQVGPNEVDAYVYETADVAVVLPVSSVQVLTTRTTLLTLAARLLFGPSRATEPPTPTQVRQMPAGERLQEVARRYWQPGVAVQVKQEAGALEIRRAQWLRLVGPITPTDERG